MNDKDRPNVDPGYSRFEKFVLAFIFAIVLALAGLTLVIFLVVQRPVAADASPVALPHTQFKKRAPECKHLHNVGRSRDFLVCMGIKPRPKFGTYAPNCDHLYNVGRSREWRECMGVGLVERQVYREDI